MILEKRLDDDSVIFKMPDGKKVRYVNEDEIGKVIDDIRSEIQHEADNNADAVEMKAFYHCLQILDKYR